MRLFINSGICERKWNVNIESKQYADKKQLCLSIPNYLETKQREEMIKFIFDDIEEISEKTLEKDYLLKDILLCKTNKNTYHIRYSEKNHEEYMYALIRSTATIPDDIFIPTSLKHKVKVLRRIRFIDDEVDYGDFLSNVYLIQINLDYHESIPIYLAYNNPYILKMHYVVYRTDYLLARYEVTKKLETFIYIDKYNKDEYISLSELC